MEELSKFALIYRAEAHNDLIGHFLTFSQAVVLLHDLGYPDLFRRALEPLKIFAKILRKSQCLTLGAAIKLSSPSDKLPLEEAESIPEDPLQESYWMLDHDSVNWLFGHTFKFPYSYYDHVRRVDPELLDRSESNFRKLLG